MHAEILHSLRQRLCRKSTLFMGLGIFLAIVLIILWMRSGPSSAALTGRVSYHGKPVKIGSVIVVDATGRAVAAPIAEDGSFRLSGVSRGPAQIGVISPDPGRAQLRMIQMTARGNRISSDL